ncbi:2-oxoacid:acceptor oxidoreductase subunit alpha [bacterium]|nr:2-oxoacid:acceptor oxidoreductase subunit alpha [bacterium]
MSKPFDYTIAVGGEAGQGMLTLGLLLTKSLLKAGYYVSTLQSYQSRIRGGHNYFQVRVSSEPIHSMISRIDILVALDKNTLQLHCDELTADSVVLYNQERMQTAEVCGATLGLEISKLYPAAKSKEVLANSIYLGVLAALMQCPLSAMKSVITRTLAKKGEDIIRQNYAALDAGWEYLETQLAWKEKYLAPVPAKAQASLTVHGNQAIALGAMAAGCKFYSAYPMTPSTGVMETMAQFMDQTGVVVEQAEDEIAALNMVLGATYAGTRAMTGTSGGGFALMVETVSLTGIIECPAVIVNSQRPGPATGLPTRTEQADLEMAIYAGHGEFPKVVLSPGNHQDCFDLTRHAFNLADEYQIPVIVLTDQYLADWFTNVKPFDLSQVGIKRGKIVIPDSDYIRYQITEDGISPRGIPGKGEGVVIVDSDEHTEDGHLTEDLDVRVQMNEKRLRKMEALKQHMLMPEVIGEGDECALVCWGSSYGPCLDVVRALQARGGAISLIYFKQVWPLDETRISSLLSGYKKLILVEGNATGQLGHVLRGSTSICIENAIHRYDGKPFLFDELQEQVAVRLEVK